MTCTHMGTGRRVFVTAGARGVASRRLRDLSVHVVCLWVWVWVPVCVSVCALPSREATYPPDLQIAPALCLSGYLSFVLSFLPFFSLLFPPLFFLSFRLPTRSLRLYDPLSFSVFVPPPFPHTPSRARARTHTHTDGRNALLLLLLLLLLLHLLSFSSHSPSLFPECQCFSPSLRPSLPPSLPPSLSLSLSLPPSLPPSLFLLLPPPSSSPFSSLQFIQSARDTRERVTALDLTFDRCQWDACVVGMHVS